MSRANKIFQPQTPLKPSVAAPAKNVAGYAAYEHDIYGTYLQMLLTNTMGNTFYQSAKELQKDAAQVHDQMLATDPGFAGKALVYARNMGFMRLQPTYGLAKLSKVDGAAFSAAFPQVIRTPNDLRDFYTILGSLGGSTGGRRVKAVTSEWLGKRLSEYWVIKYGASKAGSRALRDLIRIAHPKLGEGGKALFAYALGKEVNLSELPQIEAYERLKRAKTTAEKKQAIVDGRLPHEVVTSQLTDADKALWVDVAQQMPIFALLRNLNTLDRHGALDANRQHVMNMFTNRDVIAGSMIMPQDFLKAFEIVNSSWAKDAIRAAVELAFMNIPALTGRTAVAVDRSSSMGRDNMRTAAILGIALMKHAKNNGTLYLFDNELETFDVSLFDSTLTQAERIKSRGATWTGLPVQDLLSKKDQVDNLVVITDGEQNGGRDFMDAENEYRRKVSQNVKTFVIDISPNNRAIAPVNKKGIYFVQGMNQNALTFMGMAAQGFDTTAHALKAGKLDVNPKKKQVLTDDEG